MAPCPCLFSKPYQRKGERGERGEERGRRGREGRGGERREDRVVERRDDSGNGMASQYVQWNDVHVEGVL